MPLTEYSFYRHLKICDPEAHAAKRKTKRTLKASRLPPSELTREGEALIMTFRDFDLRELVRKDYFLAAHLTKLMKKFQVDINKFLFVIHSFMFLWPFCKDKALHVIYSRIFKYYNFDITITGGEPAKMDCGQYKEHLQDFKGDDGRF